MVIKRPDMKRADADVELLRIPGPANWAKKMRCVPSTSCPLITSLPPSAVVQNGR